ncbi:hypothetical protein FA15DRAFT_670755 [Coprinopsis marcescibilis]|uniref:Uncharacterized protein n=1 Tax=Coprinopsis marcescibilis TaxID=230819 RepID=A0A5C3KRB8_COPMA|nr:hypothetical protein FA15DRAFT_670755 [Coprinopsis marcescibilis]
MNKLRFKETGENATTDEQKHHDRRKEKRKRHRGDTPHGTSSKRHHHREQDIHRKWASSDDDEWPSKEGSKSTKHRKNTSKDGCNRAEKPDNDTLRAELEEETFRAKMFDALGDDERLDGLEARLNDFAHVPDRWRSAAMGSTSTDLYDEDEFLQLDPTTLDDDEYAEWVRLGMYRKTHAAENEERLRRKAAAAERRAAEKARRKEARQLEKEEEEARRRRKRERSAIQMEQARDEYQMRWKVLLAEANDNDPSSKRVLRFHDIPWPIAAAYEVGSSKQRSQLSEGAKAVLKTEHFTQEAISAFLLPSTDEEKPARKERLRESFLRFHPDKFEGRFLRRVAKEDEELVQETIGQVSRALNNLLENL